MKEEHILVMTTYADEAVGRSLADGLLERRLAACIQTWPIESHYTWEGVVRHDAEHLMLIKTRAALYPEVESFIRDHHDYECPEIIRAPISGGAPAYLSWLDSACGALDRP